MRSVIRHLRSALCTLLVPSVLSAQWVAQHAGTQAEFRGLHVANDSVAWAVGQGGVVIHTTDEGRRWQVDTIPGATTIFLVGVHAVDAQTAVVLGTDFAGGLSKVLRTTDGGASWAEQMVRSGAGVFFDGMAFWDAQRGFAFGDPVGGRFTIVRTIDGGRTWTDVPPAGIPDALPGEAAFAASGTAGTVQPGGHAWIGTGGGERARVFHSSDYGMTWTAFDTPMTGGQTSGIFAIAFRSSRYGLAVGGDYTKPDEASPNVLRTDDGGRTWTMLSAAVPAGVRYGLSMVPGTPTPTWIAVGPSGSGYSTDDGRTWTLIDTTAYNTVEFTNLTAGWAAGMGGRIARFVGKIGDR